MKLNGHIIITLPDFSRHFSMNEFWANRFAFVRDMNPDRVYYWNAKQIDAYYDVCKWIIAESENNVAETLRENALCGLQLLSGREISASDMSLCNGVREIKEFSDVIIATAPESLVLPQYEESSAGRSDHVRLHKIEIHGDMGQKTDVFIGSRYEGTYESGEVVYATETGGRFIELLPNHISNDSYDARLIGNQVSFRSILKIKDKRKNEIVRIRDVVSFALVKDGYIYIDFTDAIVCSDANVPLYLLCDDECKVVALSHKDGICHALYENGTVRSTDSFHSRKEVYINKTAE